MLKIFRRRPTDVRFCEACSEVCTPECRSQARLGAARTLASQQQFPIIR